MVEWRNIVDDDDNDEYKNSDEEEVQIINNEIQI